MADPVLRRWVAVHNVQLPVPAKVWGKAWRFGEHVFAWGAADGEEYPAQSFVHSGSQFEAALPSAKEFSWQALGAVAATDAGLHFNLEDVVGPEYARYLRLSNVWTLEDLVGNKVGDVLVGDKPQRLAVHDMLRQLADTSPDLAQAWLDDARRLIGDEHKGGATSPAKRPKRAKSKED